MGDFLNNHDVLKKMGFDSSNQWMFYDDRFQTFFNFLADNITDDNILTEYEVLEKNELKRRGEFIESDDLLAEKLSTLNINYPGFLEYTNDDIEALEDEIKTLEQIEDIYCNLTDQMRVTKSQINANITDIELEINELENREKVLYDECMEKAKEVQEMQKVNKKLCDESKECFSKVQTPLFMHQLPLDQYFLKCDSFMQYLSLYMKENFKIEEFLELENDEQNFQDTFSNLERIQRLIFTYSERFIKDKTNAKGLQALIDNLNVSQMHIISLADMKKETRELEHVNHHHFNITYQTLLNDMLMHLEQKSQQQMEMILYENTKQKLDRAEKRLENVKFLAKIVSDALNNSEMVWVAIQLDMEKHKNRIDNSEQLVNATQKCLKRIEIMKQLQIAPANRLSQILISKMAEVICKHSSVKGDKSLKLCMYEYEKMCRLSKYNLNAMLSQKQYGHVLELINDIESISKIISPYVFDSPVKTPMFENVRFIKSLFNAKILKRKNDLNIRRLRSQCQENITNKMNADKLWRFSQLLWIWFLTEPKRVLYAIEEVRKAASKIPALTEIKTLGGIKRK